MSQPLHCLCNLKFSLFLKISVYTATKFLAENYILIKIIVTVLGTLNSRSSLREQTPFPALDSLTKKRCCLSKLALRLCLVSCERGLYIIVVTLLKRLSLFSKIMSSPMLIHFSPTGKNANINT